jgi:hypothetical protein
MVRFASLGIRQGKKCKGVLAREVTCKGEGSRKWVAGMHWGRGSRGNRPWQQSGSWWVPGEGIFCTLKRKLCMTLCGPTVNLDLLSHNEGFSGSRGMVSKMWLDRSRPPCSYCRDGAHLNCLLSDAVHISGFGERMVVWCRWMWCLKCSGRHVAGAPSMCQLNNPSAQCRPDHTHRGCCIPLAFSIPGPKLTEGN